MSDNTESFHDGTAFMLSNRPVVLNDKVIVVAVPDRLPRKLTVLVVRESEFTENADGVLSITIPAKRAKKLGLTGLA